MFNCWLHPVELKFLNDYAEKSLCTSSEIVRGWIHEIMKMEGYELNEPTLPESIKKR
jgi:hypothetical protein